MSDLKTLLEHSQALHDHLCPRQVLGVRMGMYAAALLNLALPQSDKRLFTFVETDGCFADGVMAATGCSLGHRTMRLIDYGKAAATFIDTVSERAVRIAPHPLARTRAGHYAPDVDSHWRAQLEAYQFMPFGELLQARDVELTISLKAIISEHGLRVTCAQCGEEIINQRQVEVGGQLLCRSCAGESYWTAMGEVIELAAPQG